MGQHRRPHHDPRIVAGNNLARQIDPRDERADPGDLAIDPGGEAVLVVDARPTDADLDLARRQIRLRERTDSSPNRGDAVGILDLLGNVGTERRGYRTHVTSLAAIVYQGCDWEMRVDDRPVSPAPSRSDDPYLGFLEDVYAQAAPPYGGWGLRSRAS